jgi:hypothetical protein
MEQGETMSEVKEVKTRAPRAKEVNLIDTRKLDLTWQEWNQRFEATKVSMHQFAELTDITRPRLKRIREGERKSLVERTPGTFYVPRVYTIALIAIEMGLLTVGEGSVL